MSFNFPSSPTLGQLYPTIAVPGQPQYVWDGTSWNNNAAYPVDALALNGMQINGDMRISQELGLGGTRTTTGFVVDGWYFAFGSSAVLTVGQYNGGPLGSSIMLQVSVSTASASLAANDYAYVTPKIEGQRVAQVAWGTTQAQPVTVCFWTAHHRTGTYTVAMQNAANSRSYAAPYTQNVADTWEYKAITIPGDTAGTWAKDNTLGMNALFTFTSGTQWIAPAANTWYGVNYVAAPGQVNGVGSTTDMFRLTNVIILPGSVAPSQANQPFCFRPYDQELLLCRRYFYNGVPPLRGGATGATVGGASRMVARHPVPMRAAPTLTLTAALPVWDVGIATTITSIQNNYTTAEILEIDGNVGTAMVQYRPAIVYQGAGGNLNVDARL